VDLSPRPKLDHLNKKEILETPIAVHGKIQRYQVNVEARLDEDEDAIDILTEPSGAREKKTSPKK
jgi:hypothetical protein